MTYLNHASAATNLLPCHKYLYIIAEAIQVQRRVVCHPAGAG